MEGGVSACWEGGGGVHWCPGWRVRQCMHQEESILSFNLGSRPHRSGSSLT